MSAAFHLLITTSGYLVMVVLVVAVVCCDLLFHFEIFVRRIFISVYLHIGDVSLFWRYRCPDSLEIAKINKKKNKNKNCIIRRSLPSLRSIFWATLPDRLQRILVHVDVLMHDIWLRLHRQIRLPSMRCRQMPT